ncbi:MAG: phosphocarrier protein HPr [Gammaproteobacteria bacterium]|nr:phosphocarrier protein HPr [Gammaproteobacteria bacterium]
MISGIVTIQNKLGLHARSANLFVRTATAFASSITVINEHATANGKSIMSMMLLQAAKGTKVELQVEGEDEQQALVALEALINNKFGEDD